VGHRRWHEVNLIEDHCCVIAFPGTCVEIEQEGQPPLLATPNHAVIYRPGARYRRSAIDLAGDHCSYLELMPAVAEEIAGGRPLPPWTPITPAELLVQRMLLRRPNETCDPLDTEERLLNLAGRLIGRALHRHDHAGRRRTPAAGPARAAARMLAERPQHRIGLTRLAAEVHCSPYHLSRSFHAQTGYTLHGFRTQLRLRIALDRLAEGATDLAELSLELGFSGQSHFTNAFRTSFGIPPGRAGRQLRLGDPAAMRNFLQDLPPAPQ
jgi:AraC family transcriptional regulator